MAMKDAGAQRTWKSIESSANSCKMKYNVNSRIPKDWNDEHLGKLLKNIKEQIFDIILENADYIIG